MDLVTFIGQLYRRNVTKGDIQTDDGFGFLIENDKLTVSYPDGSKEILFRSTPGDDDNQYSQAQA